MDADKLRELNDRLLTCGNDYSDVLLDGAAEIERLRAERDKLRDERGRLVAERAGLLMEGIEYGGRAVNEINTHRARVAELARLVESAYAEGFYRAQQGGVDWDNRPNEWKGSHACAALAKEGE